MLRRASLPALAFNVSKRGRRLSTAPPELPLPSSPQSTDGFVRIQVVDFVTVPDDRLSQPRSALGPVDLAKRPPCYDLRRAADAQPDSPTESGDKVFEIPDREHIDRLCSILTSIRDSSTDEDASVADDRSHSPRTTEQLIDELADEYVEEEELYQHSISGEHRDKDSDQELTDKYDELREYDDESDVGETVDPDLDFDKDAASAFIVAGSILGEDTTITSTVLSTSSVADTSLSEFPTIASINTTDGTSEASSSVPLEDYHPSMFVAVESSECLIETRKSLPSFMTKKVPSPVKYTFRPLHKVPSNIEDRAESEEITTILPSECQMSLIAEMTRPSNASSDSNASEEPSSTELPTLDDLKNAVEKMDPHAALGIVNIPPLALATVGFFRKKRDSEDSIWSKKSSASSRKKRESDESTQSSSTEYYEDDYTKFIEKRNTFPRSPLRLRNHPYLEKIFHVDELKFSRQGFRSRSSVSVSTSDEEYIPLTTDLRNSNVS